MKTNNHKSLQDSTKYRNDKKGKKGFKRIYNAFFYSLSGIKAAWIEEEAFRQILLVSIVLIPLGIYLGDSFSSKVMLVLPCILAIMAELINSAIENAVDFTSVEINPLAKKAKDMGSAVQLIACIFLACVWIGYIINMFVVYNQGV